MKCKLALCWTSSKMDLDSATEPLEETFKTVKMRKMCPICPNLQFQNSTPVIESEQFSNARRNKNTSVHELTRTFSQLICPPASHASLGNWRLKSNTWINKKKVARVSIYLDIRCYGGKGSHTVYVTFLYWDESALYENIWEIRRNYKRYL